jgi:NAD(P)H-hydrate repair Nnr-like enzyme with NAD(P)H-hydrate dehydratase domain
VVLKGSGTVLASPGALPCINPTGNSRLATAGTGDVLAGWLGGRWAGQPGNAHAAALEAMWIHGRAADDSPHDQALLAGDLIAAMQATAGLV